MASTAPQRSNDFPSCSEAKLLLTLPVAHVGATIHYGYRVWGGNWPFDAAWTKGSHAGFISDVDDQGNWFNPNKLLLDPYALEVSHDAQSARLTNDAIFLSGPKRDTELDDSAASLYVAYNGWSGNVTATLPTNTNGKRWFRVADTDQRTEDQDTFEAPGAEEQLDHSTYKLHPRSVVVLIET